MGEGILLQIHRRQAESLRDTVEAWQAEHASALAARDAEELIRFCLDLPGEAEALWEKQYRRCFFDRSLDVPALQAMRAALETTFAEYVKAAELVRELGQATGRQTGREIGGLAELEMAVAALRELRQRVFDRWPVCSPEEMVEVRAEIARGEFVDVEDAFAEMRGISKEELRARLEELKRKRKALGME